MPLPEGFNPFEQLQDTWRRVHNKRVREHFSDLSAVDDDWDPTIDTPRGGLRVACTMSDGNSADMTIIRTLLFWVVLGEASALQAAVYGIPVHSYQETRAFKPQIQLYFLEDANDVAQDYSPVSGEITFRLMSESGATLTESNVHSLAQKCKTAFSTGSGFVWQKGKVMVSYTDKTKGYQLQLLCRTKSEGRRVIEQVLDIQNDAPNWKFMNVSENEEVMERFPTVPPQERILGRNRRLPRQRPIADVRFQYALLHLHGLSDPIVLIDRSGSFRNPVLEAR